MLRVRRRVELPGARPGERPGERPGDRPGERRGERGAVAVELALVLPMLCLLLLGTVTAGVAYSRAIAMTNAVREGARFGATADASTPATWASDLSARLRQTQFDDDGSTAVCVQLWKVDTSAAGGTAVPNSAACSQGDGSVTPALTTADASFPAVPTGLAAGTCVVRVLAARPYAITLGVLPTVSGTLKRGAVTRYEREC